MSLAYKLWKIGDVLSENNIRSTIKEIPKFKDNVDPVYLNIDFTIEDEKVISINLNRDAISEDKLFFTKKIGGTSNAFYLYPNITVLDDKPISKLTLLYNSLEYCTKNFCNENSRKQIDAILIEIKSIRYCIKRTIIEFEIEEANEELIILKKCILKENENKKVVDEFSKKIKAFEKKINKKQAELNKFANTKKENIWNDKLLLILKEIVKFKKDNYIAWLSINGKTFSERMPEVWNNWYLNPVEFDHLKDGFDVFTNKKSKIGYKTDVKVFSYDQYHDKLKFRINENLPLSLESARKIKFAWMYILENLVFYYKGLEYIIIPNLLSDDKNIYKLIIERLGQAKKHTDAKKHILINLKKEEKDLERNIENLKKEKKQTDKEENELQKISAEIIAKDLGVIQELNEQVLTIKENLNSVTLDYLFTAIDRKNLSFEIKGTIEDVIPSQMNFLVKIMRENKINDLVKLGAVNREETYLQDFFSRDELYFAVNGGSQKNKNSIFTERLFLAKLLLTDVKIKLNDLLKRFEFNRNYNYRHKKRLKNGIAEWIEYPESFLKKENNIIHFFKTLDKIQE